jgi:muramoyltetrapeptide carboxypeptidase
MSEKPQIIKPRKLEKGQTIGLVAPASPLNEDEQIYAAIDTLESLGFKVKTGEYLFARSAYLAGSDEQRAADLNAMFANPGVDAIIAQCGGYGSSRLLPMLDYDAIQRHPKVLMGYSDITALLNGIHKKTGLVTFHGPVANQAFTPYTLQQFKKVLMHLEDTPFIGSPPHFEASEGQVERKNRLTRFGSGKVNGRIIGGNLSLMAHLTGTPYAPDFDDAILFLEDVGEATYVLDRYLTQLWLSGCLTRLAGIVFGKFTDCKTSASWAKQFSVEEVLRSRCQSAGIPALRGLMIGHIEDQATVPIGCRAELDVDAGTLKLLETAVETG